MNTQNSRQNKVMYRKGIDGNWIFLGMLILQVSIFGSDVFSFNLQLRHLTKSVNENEDNNCMLLWHTDLSAND